MKLRLLAAAFFAIAAQSALAADMDHQHHMKHDAAQSAAAPMIEGTVKKLDKAAGKLTISHGPIESLGMPAMTMAFRVKNTAQLNPLKVGDKVRFRAEQVNGVVTLVALEPVK